MRKTLLLISILVLSSILATAQTVVTDDSTYTPTSTNALFEVHSHNNNKGILVPRMTTAQRLAINPNSTTDQSLLVFDTDTKTYWFYDGTSWVEMATGGTVSDDQNIDSLVLNGLILTTYIEDGQPGSVSLQAVSDSAVSYVVTHADTLFNNSAFIDSVISIVSGNTDTLFVNQTFIDSLTSIIYNQGDTLFYNQTFVDSIISVLYNNADTLLYDSTFISALQDSINTDEQTLTYDSNTGNLSISNGNTVNINELPSSALTGQVLTWDGSHWVAQNSASGADNWGTQTVQTDATLNGDGTSANPLSVNGDLTDDQDLSLSGNTLNITNGTSVDLSSFMDNTDDQNIQGCGLSGTTLTIGIENGNSQTVDLSSLQDGTGTDDQLLSISGHTISIENGNSVTVPDNDSQTLSLSGNTLSISNGNSVNLSSFMDNTDEQDLSLSGTTINITNGNGVDISSAVTSTAWSLTGNSGTTSSNFIGTTDNVALQFKIDNTFSGKIATDNTFLGYKAGINSTGSKNAFFGDGAGYNATTADENVFVGHNVAYDMQSGNSNTAVGYNAFYCYGGAGGVHAGGNNNVAIGKWAMFNPTSGDGNTALGFSSFSLPNTGSENVFVGYYSDRDGNSSLSYATAVGARSQADADYATAIGYRAYANQSNSLILGQTTNDGNPNGATANTNVGINTLTPETGANLTLGAMDGTNEGAQITWYGAGSHDTWRTDVNVNDFRIFSYSSNNNAVRIFNYGSGVTDLIVDGGQGYAVAWNTTSDKRIKTEIKNINYGLNTILALKPVAYNKHQVKGFENGKPVLGTSTPEIGLLAQDLYKVIPEIVHKPKDDSKELWAVDYSKLTPVLVKAIQEQEQEINELKSLVKQLQEQNKKILEKLNKK